MKDLDLDRVGARDALRALKTVAVANGDLDSREWRFLELESELLGVDVHLAALEGISPEELAQSIPVGPNRRALVQRLVLMAMLDEDIDALEIAETRKFAVGLDVAEPAIAQMEEFLQGRIGLLRFDLGRRSFVAPKVKDVWYEDGFHGMWTLGRELRSEVSASLAARYHALGELAPGTLGRGYFDHCHSNGFKFPGEEAGTPETLLFHDIGHVLTGYGTDPAGEVQMGGFEAGYMGEEGFSVTLLVLYSLHLGVHVVPGETPRKGAFELRPFGAAFARGRGLNVDLRRWDPWKAMDRSIADVRQLIGLK